MFFSCFSSQEHVTVVQLRLARLQPGFGLRDSLLGSVTHPATFSGTNWVDLIFV